VSDLIPENNGFVGFGVFGLLKAGLELGPPSRKFIPGRLDIDEETTRIT
jgi:hypothetical protein